MIGLERATLTHSQTAPDFFLVVRRLHPGEALLFTFKVNGNVFFFCLAKLFFLARSLVDFIGPPVKRRFVASFLFWRFKYMWIFQAHTARKTTTPPTITFKIIIPFLLFITSILYNSQKL